MPHLHHGRACKVYLECRCCIGVPNLSVRVSRWAQGVVQHATINNLAFGRNVTETLRILQAIQYVQENPDEVHC